MNLRTLSSLLPLLLGCAGPALAGQDATDHGAYLSLEFGNGRLRATVVAQLEEGRRLIRFERTDNFDQLIDEIGNPPLPPYIRRDAEVIAHS